MPEPLIAWAAVAPDGTLQPISARRRREVIEHLCAHMFYDPQKTMRQRWRRAYRADWRVVPVRIVPVEDGNV